ncbi:MAG: RecX family transcriptional regulator [Dysgonamonadaceae bacterium]|jgi:regulatory protein|nr:RecX family transcriptional regulator [Dysgonamonadaceae bacterium]
MRTDDKKNTSRKPVSEETAFSRMARICSMREYAAWDITQKLRRMNLADDAVSRVVKKLKSAKYIDDDRFARSFISDKLRFDKWGRLKIEFALRQKQIPQEVIGEAFGEFTDCQLKGGLTQLIENKLKTVRGASEYEKRNKVIRYAVGRGFAIDEILGCLINTKND